MASIRKLGNRWKVEVSKNGMRRAERFDTKAQANAWALATEVELSGIKRDSVATGKRFSDLLERYRDTVSVRKRGERWERARVGLMLRDPLAGTRLEDLDTTHVVAWRDRRLTQVSSESVRREWALLSHACTLAVREWKWLRVNPFRDVSKPAQAQPRSRRISNKEIERLLLACGYDEWTPPTTITARVGMAILFAIETAARAGEITSLTWERVFDTHIHLPFTKNGRARDVPLSKEAKRLLKRLEGVAGCEDLVFGMNSGQLDSLFRKVKKRCMIEGLHFHDTRREALTRMSKKLSALELARVSGHMDLRILQSVYYAPSVEELAGKL